MPRHKLTLSAILTLLIVAPLVGASAAHPHTHTYVGTAAHNVIFSAEQQGSTVNVKFQSAVVGLCADGSPLLRQFFPPEPIRDGDEDVGVGGGCFEFQTVYGDDTGATLPVRVQEQVSLLSPVWFTCVDVSGDGICLPNEPHNICATRATGPYSLIDGGPCTIYADPAATLNPAVFVLVIGGLTSDPSNPVQRHAGGAGLIFLG